MNLHHVRELYTRVEEMPFNSETKYMAVRCRPSYGEVYNQFYPCDWEKC